MDEQFFALLIDADNISAKYIKPILTELSKYGNITYKRIYGDWTSTQHSKWKDELLTNSITPIQQFSYTQGKNATDSAMIIDAMDILYTNDVDGFCIVSSDSDFTRLVSRLRESGKLVIGMGENKTPEPFRKACDKFTILENLLNEPVPGEEEELEETEELHGGLREERIEDEIIKMIIENQDNNKQTGLGEVGSRLVSLYPDFDVRSYGYNMLSRFLEDFTRIQLVKKGNFMSVTLKEDKGMKEDIDRFVLKLVKEAGKDGIELSILGNRVYEKYKNFKISDYGYSQFSQYIKSLRSVLVQKDKTIMKAKYTD
ncbi:NYN domain-containing protein [Extibacter muris]|uniref:NYN domain-containing protein n=1 Tax=Extibacter muris TaxID=1796622 RepID=UPI001D07EC40|nr:NYN domain-containing protein [Extibacter muris]MCB6200993.1 NYN domain-containing protein [Extibacter muris]MCQ4662323.1 NYN domain-containing protein [Extibacter muris]MCQ4691750.1 NYN domain-containing protein [Extibacter muris]